MYSLVGWNPRADAHDFCAAEFFELFLDKVMNELFVLSSVT